jgi:4-diphosphocytidyl-2-C-methyl-D-erythritol kinase
VRVVAPAKLNLGLRIVGRRADGHHELESAFVPIDLADEVDVEAEPDPAAVARVELELAGQGEGVPADAQNLAARAAQTFLEATGLRARVRIALRKRIPAAAGLGGGSSDAAGVLRALAGRFPGALGVEALAALALRLGADVPFFLDPRPALVCGIGERRSPIPGRLPSLAVLLGNPGTPLATASVFATHAAAGRAHSAPGWLEPAWRAALAGPPAGLPERLAGLLANDLEPAAEALCPALGPLRAALLAAGALAVGLSGSGATLYGLFASPEAAESARARLRLPPPAWVRLARTLESG